MNGACCQSGSDDRTDLIVALGDQVHRLEELVHEDQRTNTRPAEKDIEDPEGTGAEGVADTSLCELVTDTVAGVVVPEERNDTQRHAAEQHSQEPVHGVLPVSRLSDRIQIAADTAHDDERLDPKRQRG